MNGTVQNVVNQLRQANPNFEADFGIELATGNSNIGDPETSSVLRAPPSQRHDILRQNCLGIYSIASLSAIRNGIKYLRGVPGQPYGGPGPMECGQVSCSWNAAIWWCNDVTTSH